MINLKSPLFCPRINIECPQIFWGKEQYVVVEYDGCADHNLIQPRLPCQGDGEGIGHDGASGRKGGG